MKIFMVLFLIPCILAAELKNIQCPDGSLCPVGKTCCESPADGAFQCCDLEEKDQLNKKLVPSFISSNPRNTSAPTTSTPKYCGGEQCSDDFCCEYVSAKCCSSNSCCPEDYKCCGDDTKGWCCRFNQECTSTYMYCSEE